ncbi:WD domain, G-beta repeat protein, partial [Opisthorchis viverrini]
MEENSERSNLSWSSTYSYTTDLHPDTIEFSPSSHIALCGSYELNEITGIRCGSLYSFSSKEGLDFSVDGNYLCPGVLDLSWVDNNTVLSAHADGTLGVWLLDGLAMRPCFYEVHPGYGNVHLWELTQGIASTPVKIRAFCAHQFEAWCSSVDSLQDHVFYSGGDDGLCHMWDTRQLSHAVCTLKHEMGVCSVRNHPTLLNIISTGSYDECLRVWDLRMVRTSTTGSVTAPSTPLSSCTVGGGVWRHKWSPSGDWILVAAMSAGFATAKLISPTVTDAAKGDCFTMSIHPAGRFRSSAQLAYGIDWVEQPTFHASTRRWIVGTCSFYDNRVDFSQLLMTPT